MEALYLCGASSTEFGYTDENIPDFSTLMNVKGALSVEHPVWLVTDHLLNWD